MMEIKPRLPRRSLLSPLAYMSDVYFQQYADIIDEVMIPNVDDKISILRDLRRSWIFNESVVESVNNKQMIDNEQWSIFERDLLVNQVNNLGMELVSAGHITDNSFQNIARFLGFYWWGRGTKAFVEFMNFCLGIDMDIERLWTNDYVNFHEEYEAGPKIWEGGDWYPTTHVMLRARNMSGLSTDDIILFFYEIANYNLILYSIDTDFDIPVVANPDDEATEIVAVGLVVNSSYTINFE